MNLFNEAIYKNHLEHTAAGTKWGKHKYLYITPSGRYVYPEDIRNGQSAEQFRSRQINDQIKSAHSNATSSKMELTPGSELKKRAEARAAAKTSGTAAGSKSVATNSANRNTVSIKSDDKKTETTSTETKDTSKYKNMSEETKAWLEKNAGKEEKKEKKGSGGKKGGSGKKKGSSGSGSKKASTKTQEANDMGLSDDDLKNMEINTQATNRDEVLKNIALRVIRGDYGNGADRKAKLGNYYDEVQKRVNELMKSGEIKRQGSSGGSIGLSSTSSVAKQLSDMSGMKSSATQKLIDLYQKEGAGSDAFEKELKILSEGDDDQAKKMIAIINKSGIKSKKSSVKHYDLTEGGNYLMHIGRKRRSGRYRFGSGDRPYQHESNKRHMRKNSSFSDRRSMTDEELVSALNRVKKEVALYQAERDNRSQGQIFVERVLFDVGKDILTNAAKGGIRYAGRKFVANALGEPDLANAMFGGGGGGKKNKDKKK